jgi:hypothetical protein
MYSDVAQWHQIRRSREKETAKRQLTVTKWVPKMGDYYIGTPRRGHAHGKLASSGERPSPGIGDHHPPNVDLLATEPRCARLGGREPVAYEIGQHLGWKPVRQHDRFGAAVRRAGEQSERPSPISAHGHRARFSRADYFLTPWPPMSGSHADAPVRFGVNPSIEHPAAREDEHVWAALVDDSEF